MALTRVPDHPLYWLALIPALVVLVALWWLPRGTANLRRFARTVGRLANAWGRAVLRVLDGETRVSHGWGALTLAFPLAVVIYLYHPAATLKVPYPGNPPWRWPVIGACLFVSLIGAVLLVAAPIRSRVTGRLSQHEWLRRQHILTQLEHQWVKERAMTPPIIRGSEEARGPWLNSRLAERGENWKARDTADLAFVFQPQTHRKSLVEDSRFDGPDERFNCGALQLDGTITVTNRSSTERAFVMGVLLDDCIFEPARLPHLGGWWGVLGTLNGTTERVELAPRETTDIAVSFRVRPHGDGQGNAVMPGEVGAALIIVDHFNEQHEAGRLAWN